MGENLKDYKIAFKGLKEGKHNYKFTLNKDFFNLFEATKETEGEVEASVDIIKSSLLLQVKIKIEGTVKATCDRCLEQLDLNIEGNLDLYVKQSNREEGNDDDFIILNPEDDFIDLTTYLYETYMLSYPIKVTHKEGECDEEMEDMLNGYKAPEAPTDPRWDELKKLINN